MEIGRIHQCDVWTFVQALPSGVFDLIVCDGPYAVTTHEWDNVRDIQHYNLELLKSFSRLLKSGGAVYLFGKPDCLDFVDYRPWLNLESKIIWYQPSRLARDRLGTQTIMTQFAILQRGVPPPSTWTTFAWPNWLNWNIACAARKFLLFATENMGKRLSIRKARTPVTCGATLNS